MLAVASESRLPNRGMDETNLLSLSYGRIVPKDIGSNEGLLPQSFETYQVVNPGDVVFRLTDLQNDTHSLRSGSVHERGIITSAYLAVTPRVDPRYFAYLMRSYDLNKVFYGMGGGLRQSLKYADVRRMPVIVPPLNEQVVIADILDRETAKIDALIAKQESLARELLDRRQAAIDGVIPWTKKRAQLRRDLAFLTSGSRGWGAYYADQGDVFLRIGDLSRCSYRLRAAELQHVQIPSGAEGSRSRTRAGDLLFSITAYLGSVGIITPDFEGSYVSQHVALVRLRKLVWEPEFVAWAVLSTHGQTQLNEQAYGGTKMQLSLGDVRSFEVPVIPKQTQRELCGRLMRETESIDRLVARTEGFISLARERRSALITAAVTGQLRVGEAA